MTTSQSPPPAERRANVQASDYSHADNYVPAGTVAWWEHEEAWQAYSRLFGTSQSAERIHQRSGFCYRELTDLLGHKPITWVARQS